MLLLQCITEAERYSAKGYVAKPEKNKGAQKQEAWTECLQELACKATFDHTTKNVLQRVASQPNVPRKKDKFLNFLKNCLRIGSPKAEQVWKLIEDGLAEFKQRTAAETAQSQTNSDKKAESNSSEQNGTTENGTGNTDKNAEIEGIQVKGPESNGKRSEESLKLVDFINHALTRSDLQKPVKKTLKKLKKAKDVPFNVDKPRKKKFLKHLQQHLELDDSGAKNIWTIITDSIEVLRSTADSSKVNEVANVSLANGTGNKNGTEVAVNGKPGKKRKNSSSELGPEDKKAKNGVNTNGESKNVNDNNSTITNVLVDNDAGDSVIDWEQSILKIVSKFKADKELNLEVLKSKLIKKHGAHLADTPKVEKKILKKVKKINQLNFENGIITLKT